MPRILFGGGVGPPMREDLGVYLLRFAFDVGWRRGYLIPSYVFSYILYTYFHYRDILDLPALRCSIMSFFFSASIHGIRYLQSQYNCCLSDPDISIESNHHSATFL